MTNKYIMLLLGFILVNSACTPPVVFDVIDRNDITLRKENYFLLPLKDVEEKEDCRISGEQMYVTGRSECIPLEYINDSIVKGTVVEHDTLFVMSEGSVARMYNGHVVLSQELKSDQWAVSLLSLEANADIKYRAITDKTKIKNVGRITPMENITIEGDKKDRYKIKPTMKEFDELLSDEKVFIECEYLSRVLLDALPTEPIIINKLN